MLREYGQSFVDMILHLPLNFVFVVFGWVSHTYLEISVFIFLIHVIAGFSFLGNNSFADIIKLNTSFIQGLEIDLWYSSFARVIALVNQITKSCLPLWCYFLHEKALRSLTLSSLLLRRYLFRNTKDIDIILKFKKKDL